MKKMIIGLAAITFILPFTTLAASPSNTKDEVSVPCYNGGFNFGLAGYYSTAPATTQDTNKKDTTSTKDSVNAPARI